MAVKSFGTNDFRNGTISPSKTVYVDDDGIRLKKRNSSGSFDRGGSYVLGTITLPNFKASGISSLLGFEEFSLTELEQPDPDPAITLGTIEYQLSNDAGTTFYYWSGSAWVVATSSDWSPVADVDSNISTFSLKDPIQFQVKVRISPAGSGEFSGSGKYTPILYSISVAFGLKVDTYVDLLESFQDYLESNLEIRFQYLEDLTYSTDKVSITFFEDQTPSSLGFTIFGDPEVYNLTDDSDRQTDLFSSLSGNEITMTSAQDSGDRVEVNWKARTNVILAQEEDIFISKIPAIVVRAPTMLPDAPLREAGEIPILRSKYRTTPIATSWEESLYYTASFEVSILSPLAKDAWAMASAMKRVAELIDSFPSLATGYQIQVLDFFINERDQISAGLHVRDITVEVRGKQFMEEATVTNLATTISLNLGDFDDVYMREEVVP